MRLDDEQTILYTRGSVDFFRTYPGMYVSTRSCFTLSAVIRRTGICS